MSCPDDTTGDPLAMDAGTRGAAEPAIILETPGNAGADCGLRILLQRSADRYHHLVEAYARKESFPLLGSREDVGSQDWPCSPPLQQLSVEQRAAGPVALLVGMAGQSHWSASLELLSDPPQIRFDVACRLRQPADRLGSTYQLLTAANFIESNVILSAGPLRLRLHADNGTSGVTRLVHNGNQVVIRPAEIEPGRLPCTIRWQYCVEMMTC